jgi:hypothetical protein
MLSNDIAASMLLVYCCNKEHEQSASRIDYTQDTQDFQTTNWCCPIAFGAPVQDVPPLAVSKPV